MQENHLKKIDRQTFIKKKKTSSDSELKGNFNLLHGIFRKRTTNIILIVKYPFSSLLFNSVSKVLASEVRQDKKIKDIQIGKEEVKTVFFCR